jgi:thiamine biosynthesis lipoprotein
MPAPRSNRREFLQGRAAADALLELVDPAEPSALSHPDRPASTYLVQYGRRAMACQFQLFVNAGQYADALPVALQALDLVDALEEQLTVYRDTSEVMEINRRAFNEPVLVERRLCELLAQALRLHHQTDAAYDITAGPLSKVWGFYRRQGTVPAEADLQTALTNVGSQWIEIDVAEQTVRFKKPQLELNLGSIGKGYALDRCAELLAENGMEHYLWHGGQSSVLARGDRGAGDQQGWLIAVGDPLRPGKHLAQIRLHNQAMGTSGAGTQFFRHAGRRFGHILDPRTGWPAEGVYSVTVIGPTAAEADALSTAFYVMGPDAAAAYCQRHGGIGMLMVVPASNRRGERIVTEGINAADLTLLRPA